MFFLLQIIFHDGSMGLVSFFHTSTIRMNHLCTPLKINILHLEITQLKRKIIFKSSIILGYFVGPGLLVCQGVCWISWIPSHKSHRRAASWRFLFPNVPAPLNAKLAFSSSANAHNIRISVFRPGRVALARVNYVQILSISGFISNGPICCEVLMEWMLEVCN